jgi:CTP synthase
MRLDVGPDNSALVHVTYLPFIAAAGELKSKPTQHSVKELREIGLQPDFLVCRSEKKIEKELKSKIGLFCSVKPEHVIAAEDSSTIYEVPLALHLEKLDELIVKHLKIERKKPDLTEWQNIVQILHHPQKTTRIAIVGKYVDLKESYKSLHESLVHGGIANNCKVQIDYVDSEKLNQKNVNELLKNAQAVLVPGGFGLRGVDGKLLAIKYARENLIPYFGICFGMQLAAIEFARNVLGIKDATSREFVPENKRVANLVIDFMAEQRVITNKGGTMRLGAYACDLKPKSKVADIYKASSIFERHRHRYEFNSQYKELFEKKGMTASGICKERDLVEILELQDHPWFIAVQFHPEFKSKPLDPHPLFMEFVKASLKTKSKSDTQKNKRG